jgi:hypothetical protein
MPTSFLDLPGEIRNKIYKYALVSPTGLVFPLINGRLRSSEYSLYATVDRDSKDAAPQLYMNDDTLAVSLHRTCRQIYQETAGLLWSNTFYFIDPERASFHLKAMGQGPSRQMRFASVGVQTHWKAMPKCFARLSSRARLGCFESLLLHFDSHSFGVLAGWNRLQSREYDEVLDILREGNKECNFQRTIRVARGCATTPDDFDTIRDLHFAFGGKLIYEEKLLWDDYQYVRDIVE